MRRGISPVIASTLLILVGIAVVAIIYPWATAAAGQVSNAIFRNATIAEKELLADIQINTPPAENLWNQPLPAIIHNSGMLTLTNMKVYISDQNSQTLTNPTAVKWIRTDGSVEDYNFDTNGPIDEFAPGETLVVWLPDVNNYYGYTIIVTSEHYQNAKTIGVIQ